MKKHLSLLLFVMCLSLYLLAGFEIAHAKTQLTRVKGTNISLIPPSGFSETAKFSGFWKTGHYAFINVREVDLPFAKTLGSLTSFRFSTSEKVTVGTCEPQQQGQLCRGTVTDSGYFATKLVYLFPINKNRTVIIEGVVGDKEYKQTLEQVHTALLTAIYTGSVNSDPIEASDYIVDQRAPFQFIHKIALGYVLTKTDKFLAGELDVTFYLIRSLGALDASMSSQAKKELSSFGSFSIQSEQPVKINGMKGYEIIARVSNAKLGSRLIYQVLIPTRSAYYVLRGILNSENEKYLPVVKEIAATFRKKGSGL